MDLRQRPYPVPASEAGRLEALWSYQIVDTPPEREFDSLVSLASRIFSCPVAYIALVDDTRQFIKAHIGMEAGDAGRDASFCTYTILQNDVLYLADATQDPRFEQNLFVTGNPQARFYAGAPLITPSGHAIGSLSIMDTEPRPDFTADQMRTLRDLASLVVDRLEVRRLNLQRCRNEQRLEHLAHFDSLTGLPNRASLWMHIDSLLAQGLPVNVLMADIDNFKEGNDALGQLHGDEILKHVARRIRAVVPKSMFVARPSGDEFAIVVEGDMTSGAFERLCREILADISAPFQVDGRWHEIEVSIGIAIAPQHGVSAQELLASADLALQEARLEGRGRVEVFTPALRQALQSKRSIEIELKRAYENGELEIVYQPQVKLSDSSLVGAEALLRWRHPERGVLSPSDFISVLESMPLAVDVGTWIIETACRQSKEWSDAGSPIQVAVNLFASQLDRKADLVGVVDRALQLADLSPGGLELEITENIILRREAAMIAQLHQLRKKGVGISFDDFGTGFASLSHLKSFPLTKLKIDQSFVAGLCSNSADAAVVEAILHLGRSFRFKVVAEGVETLEQHDRLLSLGCSLGQGFLFGRAMSPADFSSRLPDWREVA